MARSVSVLGSLAGSNERRFNGGSVDAGLAFGLSAEEKHTAQKRKGRHKERVSRERRASSAPSTAVDRQDGRQAFPSKYFDGSREGYEYVVPPFGEGEPGYYPVTTVGVNKDLPKTAAQETADSLARIYAGMPTHKLQEKQFTRMYGYEQPKNRGRADGSLTDASVYGAGCFVQDTVKEFEKQGKMFRQMMQRMKASDNELVHVFDSARKGADPSTGGPGFSRNHHGGYYHKSRQGVSRPSPRITEWDTKRAPRTISGNFYKGRSPGLPSKKWDCPDRVPAFSPTERGSNGS